MKHVIFLLLILASFPAGASYTLFEAPQSRPLQLSADGTRLFVLNTPDDQLEIFQVRANGLTHESSVAVGMRPVAIAVRNENEVWVANHLSDSISIVDISENPRVIRTLLVGDEPGDIIFAGDDRAFITTAHRGQANPTPRGEYDVAGVGRADVWVFDAANPGPALGGNPITIVNLFGDKPRALAASNDGSIVYAGVFHSGNKTTAINEGLVCNGGSGAAPCAIEGGMVPGGLPAPNANHEGTAGPETGLIVQYENGQWTDELDRDWSDAVRFDLPDYDLFLIDADAATPVEIDRVSGVGTVLFNIAVNPVNGRVYVSNTDANNRVRFEGTGEFAAGQKPVGEPNTVRGNLHKSQITVINGTTPSSRHLNKHIDYEAIPVPAGIEERSLATPAAMAISADGNTLYLAAFGSQKIAIFDTEELDDNSFVPSTADHIELNGGGPSGLALDEPNNRLFVLTRFDNQIRMIDLANRNEIFSRQLHSPESLTIVDGRPFLYDARLTSSNGEASCASCHIFGDMDDLAWDLGDPDGDVADNPNPFTIGGAGGVGFHPMKGPMTTQSLRGMADHGPLHWRGDRTGGNDTPAGDPLDENAAFNSFNVAFPGLLGRDEGELTPAQMQSFTDFALQLTYPPNPIRQLDNALRADESRGRNHYFQTPGPDIVSSCHGCHTLDPVNGFFGGNGGSSIEGETQEFKIPHLRNVYQKIGMFGMPDVPFIVAGDHNHQGDQIRGYGYLHDGSIDTVDRFFQATVFDAGFNAFFPDPVAARKDLEAFMMAFDSNLAPIVGQQITLTQTNATIADPRIDLLIARANAAEADLVVRATVAGVPRSGRYSSGEFIVDDAAAATLTEPQVRSLAAIAGQEVTYVAVPPGAGIRLGVDRDLDGIFNFNDVCPATADSAQTDSDNDAIGNACDNCTIASNPDQRDSNGDGYGNACDADLNNDNIIDFTDLNMMANVFFTADPDADFNGDGAVDFIDLAVMADLFFGEPGPSAF